MELRIKERLLIPSLFPEKNSLADFGHKKSIINKLAISEADRKEYGIVENKQENRIEWNVQKDMEQPLIVDFSKEELAYMAKSCEQLSEQQLPDEMWVIAEKIYEEAQNA